MLYVTTRNKFDTYTVHRANQSDRGPDGGLYLPFRMPKFDNAQLLALQEQSFGQRVAQVLNFFFAEQLTGWDVELCAGKNPVQLVPMNHRILVAETWHNHDWDFARLERSLAARIYGYDFGQKEPTSWMKIAIRMAMLFGIYGQLLADKTLEPGQGMDVAVATGDFSAPMAVWYAREMGLPVGNIICCHDQSCVWDLIHHGEVRTDLGLPENLERLVSAVLGVEENLRYCDVCEKGKLYVTTPGMLDLLRKGMYATVISRDRLTGLIPSVYRTGGYILGPQSALAYGGLQDYRARTGENRLALMFADRSPRVDGKLVASVMGITEQELLRELGE